MCHAFLDCRTEGFPYLVSQYWGAFQSSIFLVQIIFYFFKYSFYKKEVFFNSVKSISMYSVFLFYFYLFFCSLYFIFFLFLFLFGKYGLNSCFKKKKKENLAVDLFGNVLSDFQYKQIYLWSTHINTE